jgi:2-keto-3-deoxy-L-rhamnonate aldolase RhmA
MVGLLGASGEAMADVREGDDASFSEKVHSDEPLWGISDPLQGVDSAAIVSQHPATDWVWVDAEHGAFWIKGIRQKLATFPDDTAGLVRVPGGDAKEVEQVLDAGADGVIIPKKRDPEEVRRFVDSAYYPPEGDRGVAGTVATGPDFTEYYEGANEETFVVVQVETKELVENIDEVARIDGIDSLLVGPADLSHSLGDPFDYGTEAFRRATRKVLRAAKEHDVIPGYWVGSRDESAFLERGWRMLSLGSASGLLGNAIQQRIP